MVNILVTGGNGFIGSHLVDALQSTPENQIIVIDNYPRFYDTKKPKACFVQGSLSDIDLVRRTIEDKNIDLVYHLAWTSIPETSISNMVSDIESNLTPSVNLLNFCKNSSVKRVIFVSSGGAVYGIPKYMPVLESHPTNPISAYGISKLMVEKYLKLYQNLYGLEYVILRPSVPYGPRQNPHRRQGVVSVFIYNALHHKPVTIWGDGENIVRDYFFISDLVKALVSASCYYFQQKSDNEFNLAGEQICTINQLIEKIECILNLKIGVICEPYRRFDIPKLHLDISHAQRELNWYPKVTLEEGINITADWLKKNLE